MVSPFNKFEDLAPIWAQSAPVTFPRADLAVTVRFPPGCFEKLQDHFRRDSAIAAFSRLLVFATAQAHLQVGSAFTQDEISNACVLTLEQMNSIVGAPADSDAAVVFLMGKKVTCFKWNEPAQRVGDGHSSDLECALMTSLEKANVAIRNANTVLSWSRFDPASGY